MTAPIPNVQFSFPNDGLGNVPQSPSNIIAVFGASSAGTAAVPTQIGGNAGNVSSQFGYGPGPSLAGALVDGGATVVFTKVTSAAGTVGAVEEGAGVGTSNMTITGTPKDRYDIVVTVARGGTAQTDLTCAVTISLDGGRTASKAMTIPVSGSLATMVDLTGLTFVFSAGTLVVDTTYSSAVTPPVVTAADVVTALAALKTSVRQFSMIYICGAFDADDCATIMTEIASFIPRKRFCRVFLEAVDDDAGDGQAVWAADLIDDFVDFSSDLASVAAGYIGIPDVFTKAILWRSIGWLAAVRASQVAVQRDLACVEDGSLSGIAGGPNVTGTPAPDHFVHDEDLNPLLNDQRFMTIRSLPGYQGYYITNPNVMAGPTSDYDLLQYGRIADEVARLTNIYFTRQLSRDLFRDPSTGNLLASEVKSLEQGNDQALLPLKANQAVSAYATAVNPVPTGSTIQVTVRIVPKFYAKEFDVTIAFATRLPAAS